MEYKNLIIKWLGHDTFRITDGNHTIFFDPFEVDKVASAHFVFITHPHHDHCSVEDIKKVCTDKTHIFATADCMSKLRDFKNLHIVEVGQKIKAGDIEIEVVPAYNIDKEFHIKEQGWAGYIINFRGTKIYHAGDTDMIPEMGAFDCDIALLPVSGTYVMTAEQAADAVQLIKPKIAIPMHYGSIVGSEKDAQRFKQLADCTVEILDKE